MLSLHQKGARLGPVLAFLVATPATSLTALLVCYALMGIKFTVFIFFVVIAMGLVMGAVGNLVKLEAKGLAKPLQTTDLAQDSVCGMSVDIKKAIKTEYADRSYYFCCSHCRAAFEKEPEKYVTVGQYGKSFKERMRSVFGYAFVDMVKEIGPELLLGLVLVALVAAVAPLGKFVGSYLGGGFGYLFSLVFGLVMCICSTASVPLVHAFISQGMNIGAGMVLLLIGPITSWGTILVLRKKFGIKIVALYLVVISIMALALGYLFSIT